MVWKVPEDALSRRVMDIPPRTGFHRILRWLLFGENFKRSFHMSTSATTVQLLRGTPLEVWQQARGEEGAEETIMMMRTAKCGCTD